jgi:hypothetical protein
MLLPFLPVAALLALKWQRRLLSHLLFLLWRLLFVVWLLRFLSRLKLF